MASELATQLGALSLDGWHPDRSTNEGVALARAVEGGHWTAYQAPLNRDASSNLARYVCPLLGITALHALAASAPGDLNEENPLYQVLLWVVRYGVEPQRQSRAGQTALAIATHRTGADSNLSRLLKLAEDGTRHWDVSKCATSTLPMNWQPLPPLEEQYRRLARFPFSTWQADRLRRFEECHELNTDVFGRPYAEQLPAEAREAFRELVPLRDAESLYVCSKFVGRFQREIIRSFAVLSAAETHAAVTFRSLPGSGWTMLHQVAFMGHLEVAQLLCRKGGSLAVESSEAETPRDIAIKEGHQNIADYFSLVERQRQEAAQAAPTPTPVPAPSPAPSSSSSSSLPALAAPAAPVLQTSVTISNECTICFERPRDAFLPCGHLFCMACVQQLSLCPVCKQKFSPEHVKKAYL